MGVHVLVCDPLLLLPPCSAGHVLYIHCAGGHGRTGQVAINLLEALYALDLETAQHSAITFHQGRTSGKCTECHELPEMPIQEAQLRMIAPMAARERALVLALATPAPVLLHAAAPPKKKAGAAPSPSQSPSPSPPPPAPAPAHVTAAPSPAPAPSPPAPAPPSEPPAPEPVPAKAKSGSMCVIA